MYVEIIHFFTTECNFLVKIFIKKSLFRGFSRNLRRFKINVSRFSYFRVELVVKIEHILETLEVFEDIFRFEAKNHEKYDFFSKFIHFFYFFVNL